MNSDGELTYLARIKKAPRYYASGLYREISDKNVFVFAQAIAFKVLITIVPIVILAVGVTGRLLEQDIISAFGQIRALLEDFLPEYQSEQLLLFLQNLLDASSTFTIIGAIGFFLSAVTLATTVRLAVGGAFQQEWNSERTIFGGYAFDVRLVLQVGLFFVLTVLLTLAAQSLAGGGEVLSELLGLNYQWLSTGWQGAFRALGLLIPFLVTTAMFFQLFYFIPVPRPPRRSALVGALVTAVLWEAAKFGFTFYARYVGQFERYGNPDVGDALSEEGMIALGSGFGLLIAFIFWVYYSGIVLMIGAIMASLHERHRRIRLRQAGEAGRAPAPESKLEAAAHQEPVPPEEKDEQDEQDDEEDDGAGGDGAPHERAPATPLR